MLRFHWQIYLGGRKEKAKILCKSRILFAVTEMAREIAIRIVYLQKKHFQVEFSVAYQDPTARCGLPKPQDYPPTQTGRDAILSEKQQ